MADVSPQALFQALGDAFPPSDQQAEVIGATPGPMLVVAGAGAGKTKTMADRVVWLVANGYVRPEEVLGLTFTRKAARELGQRIRHRLQALARHRKLVRELDPSGVLAESLEVIAPTVATYDSYAGQIVRDYGLLVPVEPDARLITQAELHSIAVEVVRNYNKPLVADGAPAPAMRTVVDDLLGLTTAIGNALARPEDIDEAAEIFLKETESLPKSPRSKTEFSQKMTGWRNKQRQRQMMLPLVEQLNATLRERGVVTFNEQMNIAALLAEQHASVGAAQRQKYRVVMLDEYQDTSHSQRVLLRSLFGQGQDPTLTVTAVGDPMQAIYGWRGATSENLAAFVEDFPAAHGAPAPKKQLTISWRNPSKVLEMANQVSTAILGTGEQRAVEPLAPRKDAAEGEVVMQFFEREEEEIEFVADALQQQFEQSERLSAAVLTRKNRQAQPIAQALEARGVPYEIVGLGGLLDTPEVQDTLAVATMLVRPEDSAAALRVLGGPSVGLGLADMEALAERAKNLQARAEGSATQEDAPKPADPEERLIEELTQLALEAEALKMQQAKPAGLADAVADLGEPERFSEEGYKRLRLLASRLRQLRRNSLGKRLSDLFADIIEVFGIRVEVLARQSSAGTVHLDQLLHYVEQYPGTSVEALLDYFELAKQQEDGLTPGNVTVRGDRVQILTVHKAKGLEWDTVAVLHADKDTYSSKIETFLSQIPYLQPETFGDPDIYEDFADVEHRTGFQKAADAWRKHIGEDLAEEQARLFYVAITRTENKLLITGSKTSLTGKNTNGPYEHFAAFEGFEMPEEPEDEAEAITVPQPEAAVGTWPRPSYEAAHAANSQATRPSELVRGALETEIAPAAGELYELWERDATALIEEHKAAQSPDVPVMLPGELTASDMVAMQADAEQFARRARRPVPFKPNQYAKRGTAFHEWIEDFYGAHALLTEDELPGMGEAEVDPSTLKRLKANFEDSHWASKTPTHVECPFELALGKAVVRGRMDAVFEDGDGWVVVDWKTGTRPVGAAMEAAKLQLAVYTEAWKRIANDGRPVRAVFFYVRDGKDFTATDLPDAQQLTELLEDAANGATSGTVSRRSSEEG
ncbi:DNA helicase II [Corynebacterium sp. NML140438]|uniref:ATP-dependent helicase n=1 Tax=Corynebacterium sp. NML140438 TaxID=1906334 RepID=UPI0008FAFA46|nr:UvrD-helicase domain-containing protein [Corynebacterium sp. NML140438]OIR40599.1 DNA helicase II [Corynebacterium sp. NML140438]